MIQLEHLNGLSRGDFVAALDGIVEHATWVLEAAHEAAPFADLAALLAAVEQAIRAAAPERRLALLRGHPDLAGKAARAGDLTRESTAEQASAGLDRLSAEEFAAFHRLNDAYRARFGFPFLVCVRRHGKESILRQFERRVGHDQAQEEATAIDEIRRIVALRLDQRVDAPERLKVHGRLSTHVLDTQRGRPAQGIAIALHELDAAGRATLVAEAVTNADGRTDQPLIAGRPVPIARYELRFAVSTYFRVMGVEQADPPFLDTVPIRFAVAEPEGHYHVPLLVTPWSYSTYRGS
jgi:2-oxo-4-hydroxy-4-carboxy-5-ureidoimidazoline decarboxylase